jgi:4,5-dihydroxyphthalate decarboxylase
VTEPIVLRIALGTHAHVAPLVNGELTSPRILFQFIEFDPLPQAFRNMVRGDDLDVSEMAVTTHLLALDFGKPLTALPAPLWRRLHHSNLVCLNDSTVRGPKDLEGKKVGVRAYSQTTGVWIRGILKTRYGVDLDKITWITMEDAHVAGFKDPPQAVRNATGKGLRDLLHSGELEAIMGERNVDPANIRSVIPDAENEARAWSKETGVFPVNHIVSVRTQLLERHEWLADELMRLLDQARIVSGVSGVAAMPYGIEPIRPAVKMLSGFALDQRLTAKEYAVEDIFWGRG